MKLPDELVERAAKELAGFRGGTKKERITAARAALEAALSEGGTIKRSSPLTGYGGAVQYLTVTKPGDYLVIPLESKE